MKQEAFLFLVVPFLLTYLYQIVITTFHNTSCCHPVEFAEFQNLGSRRNYCLESKVGKMRFTGGCL